jgi:hypothetical protein
MSLDITRFLLGKFGNLGIGKTDFYRKLKGLRTYIYM